MSNKKTSDSDKKFISNIFLSLDLNETLRDFLWEIDFDVLGGYAIWFISKNKTKRVWLSVLNGKNIIILFIDLNSGENLCKTSHKEHFSFDFEKEKIINFLS